MRRRARNRSQDYPSSRSSGSTQLGLALLFLGVVAGAVLMEKMPVAVLVIYLLASLVTFILYALDKAAARKGRQRTPERTLHWMAVMGGWPGAMFAQQLLRHKSIKPDFRRVFWVTIAINCAALAYLLTPHGAQLLRTLTR